MSRPLTTEDQRRTFATDGVVLVPGVLDPAVLQAMAGPVAATLLDPSTGGDLTEMGALLDGAAEPVPEARGRFRGGVDHWQTMDEFRHFACDTTLPAVAAELMGSSSVALYEDSVLVKEPGTEETTKWHVDFSYFHIDGNQACTFWCPLDAVDHTNGATRYLVGSHLDTTEYRPNYFVSDIPMHGTEGEVVPVVDEADPRIVSFSAQPGDVVVHHSRTLHSASANRSDRNRRVISVRYCGDDITYRNKPGATAKPSHAELTEGGPIVCADHPRVWP